MGAGETNPIRVGAAERTNDSPPDFGDLHGINHPYFDGLYLFLLEMVLHPIVYQYEYPSS